MQRIVSIVFCTVFPVGVFGQALNIPWSGYAHDPQHTAVSANPSQALNHIYWSTPVDLDPPGGTLFIHYGSPIVTAANTVLLPVKTGVAAGGANCGTSSESFEIQALNGTNGNLIYCMPTDYSLPPANWTPPYGPVLSLRNRMYFPGAGGTVYYRDLVDSPTGPNGQSGASGQIAFYGNSLYAANQAAFSANVQISTPLMSDRYGDIFFGFVVQGTVAAMPNLVSGIARISVTGAGSWVSALSTTGIRGFTQLATNCAPTLSNDQRTLYFAVTNGASGYLVSVSSTTLAPNMSVLLVDPSTGDNATVTSESSASPMVGTDGDVYYGVLESNCCGSHNFRGWMLHFNSTLTQTKIPGSFGWDDTASIVASNLVPSYTGTSSYLILTKYNNYVGMGTGSGVNQVAVLDPNTPMPDHYSTAAVMEEVLTIDGVTPDPKAGFPDAVREWCINTAVIDPFTLSAIVNSEDGFVYRWSFATNSFTQRLQLTGGIGEAYTSTVIGVDGKVYAINDATLFAVGELRP